MKESIAAFWRHIAYNYREGGVRQVIGKVFGRLEQWLWSESSWLIYSLDAGACPYRFTERFPLLHRLLGFDDLVRLRYFKALDFPEFIRERIAQGALCHGFFLGSQLVNIAWSTTGRLDLESDLSIPDKKCIGIFDCVTFPDWRSKGIYTNTLLWLARFVYDQGAAMALIAVDPDNVPSIKGIERAGFQPAYRLRRMRRFGTPSFEKPVFASRFGASLLFKNQLLFGNDGDLAPLTVASRNEDIAYAQPIVHRGGDDEGSERREEVVHMQHAG